MPEKKQRRGLSPRNKQLKPEVAEQANKAFGALAKSFGEKLKAKGVTPANETRTEYL